MSPEPAPRFEGYPSHQFPKLNKASYKPLQATGTPPDLTSCVEYSKKNLNTTVSYVRRWAFESLILPLIPLSLVSPLGGLNLTLTAFPEPLTTTHLLTIQPPPSYMYAPPPTCNHMYPIHLHLRGTSAKLGSGSRV